MKPRICNIKVNSLTGWLVTSSAVMWEGLFSVCTKELGVCYIYMIYNSHKHNFRMFTLGKRDFRYGQFSEMDGFVNGM